MERIDNKQAEYKYNCDECYEKHDVLIKFTAINNGKAWLCKRCLTEALEAIDIIPEENISFTKEELTEGLEKLLEEVL